MNIKTLDDILLIDIFKDRRKWFFKDLNKSKYANLALSDRRARLYFEVAKDEVDSFSKPCLITAKTDYSRIVLLSSFAVEDFFSKKWGKKNARMEAYIEHIIYQPFDNKLKEAKVSNITGSLPGIGDWFDVDFLEFDDSQKKFANKQLIYHDYYAGKTLRLRISSWLDTQIESSEFKARQESSLELKFSGLVNVGNALRIFDIYEAFFNLVFSKPFTAHIHESINDNRVTKFRKKIVYIITPNRYRVPIRRDRDNNAMLFKLIDVKDINKVFTRWLTLYSQVQEVVDSLLILRRSDVGEDLRFTLLLYSIELLHRRFYPGTVMPEDEFVIKKNEIINQIVLEENKKFISDLLKYANEKRLRARLRELWALCEAYGLTAPPKNMINRIINRRTELVHGVIQTTTLNSTEQYKVNSFFGRCIKLLLLIELNLSQEEINRIIRSSPHFEGYFRDEVKSSL